jgi:putative Holliday junction resolvase
VIFLGLAVNYLGIDYGRKRLGLSICHGNVGIPLPLEAVISDCDGEKIAKICAIIGREKIGGIAIGYPLNMDSSIGAKASEVDAFIEKLASSLQGGIPINRVDERLTSEQVYGDERVFYGGQSPAKRKKRRRSGATDSKAATIILQDFLNELNLSKNR